MLAAVILLTCTVISLAIWNIISFSYLIGSFVMWVETAVLIGEIILWYELI